MASQGPLAPATVINDTSGPSGATENWSNPTNAKTADSIYATAPTGDVVPSHYSIKIVRGGVISGTDQSDGSSLPGSLQYTSWGGSSNLWGLSWSVSDINSSGFGVAYSVLDNGHNSTPSYYLKATNFGFSIPAGATINGILVEINELYTSPGAGLVPSNVDNIRITVTYTPGTATVTTGSATSITTIDAVLGGNVTSDGGNTITERGVCWGMSANPTTSSSKATASGTTGSYTVSATSLTQSTTYHYRAYAINSAGTSYGSDQTFTTNGFTNPANAYADDSSYATTPGDTGDIWIQLSGDGGTTWTSQLTKTYTSTESLQTYGNGATELWGQTWTNTNVNDTNFRLRIGAGTATWGEIYKTFGFSAPTSVMTGIEVEVKAKWDGATTSINYIAVKIHYGTSITPVIAGSFAYATDGGGGTGAPATYNGTAWKELVDTSSSQTLASKEFSGGILESTTFLDQSATTQNISLPSSRDFLTLGKVEIGAAESLTIPSSSSLEITPPPSARMTGEMIMWAGGSPPAGWLLCNGMAISRTTYATLYALIGTTYGSGDGSTTFNLPDLRQRFPLGQAASGTGATLGSTGGSVDHTHPLSGNGQAQVFSSGTTLAVHRGSTANYTTDVVASVSFGADTTTRTLGARLTGNTDSANPPYQVVNFIIRY